MELRVLQMIWTCFFSVWMMARFVEVSVRPGISGCIEMTPWGRATRRPMRAFREAASIGTSPPRAFELDPGSRLHGLEFDADVFERF
jgi:hypothetical protein